MRGSSDNSHSITSRGLYWKKYGLVRSVLAYEVVCCDYRELKSSGEALLQLVQLIRQLGVSQQDRLQQFDVIVTGNRAYKPDSYYFVDLKSGTKNTFYSEAACKISNCSAALCYEYVQSLDKKLNYVHENQGWHCFKQVFYKG